MKEIIIYDKMGYALKVARNITDASKYTNTKVTGIKNCLVNRNKSSNGYQFKYKLTNKYPTKIPSLI